MCETNKRLGFVGVIIDKSDDNVSIVNEVLSEYSSIIVGRMGIPYRERGCAVITLVVDATNDEIGSLTGKLGNIAGVSVKSALAKN
ncbi:MAG: iron-only hydrogenase system regulator [Kiritimatiellae bacterium]|jgi:putative iron-only hydrogenase system regulator|nr:iron-only hydrogenase system regulator [Kiritimatiellia bacterium]